MKNDKIKKILVSFENKLKQMTTINVEELEYNDFYEAEDMLNVFKSNNLITEEQYVDFNNMIQNTKNKKDKVEQVKLQKVQLVASLEKSLADLVLIDLDELEYNLIWKAEETLDDLKSKNVITEEEYANYKMQLQQIRTQKDELELSKEASVSSNQEGKIIQYSDFANKKYSLKKGIIKVAASALIITSFVSLASCSNEGNKSNSATEKAFDPESVSQNSISENTIKVTNEITENVLSENVSFDVNDNEEIVNRSVEFFESALLSGVDLTDSKDIERYMDFYMYLNIDEIDPKDYSRLKYYSKTTESIVSNYQYIANKLADDLFYVTMDTKIDYSIIIADKKSAEMINEFQDKIAILNSFKVNSNDWKKQRDEITQYLKENYLEIDNRWMESSSYEFLARMMFSFDEMTNGLGLPEDIKKALYEDKWMICSNLGEATNSMRNQSNTIVRGMLNSKLKDSRDFDDQDLSLLPEYEKKIGVELEQLIEQMVDALNIEFVANKKWENPFAKLDTPNQSTTTKEHNQYVSPTTNETVTIADEEFLQHDVPIGNVAEYEQKIIDEYKEERVARTNEGTIINNTDQYTINYTNGYNRGVRGKDKGSPTDNSVDAINGLNDGYQHGKMEYDLKQAEFDSERESHFEEADDDHKKTIEETEVEYGYTGNPYVPGNTVIEDPIISDPDGILNQGSNDQIIEESTEEYDDEDYFHEFEPVEEEEEYIEVEEEELSISDQSRNTSISNRLKALKSLRNYIITFEMPDDTLLASNMDTMLAGSIYEQAWTDTKSGYSLYPCKEIKGDVLPENTTLQALTSENTYSYSKSMRA